MSGVLHFRSLVSFLFFFCFRFRFRFRFLFLFFLFLVSKINPLCYLRLSSFNTIPNVWWFWSYIFQFQFNRIFLFLVLFDVRQYLSVWIHWNTRIRSATFTTWDKNYHTWKMPISKTKRNHEYPKTEKFALGLKTLGFYTIFIRSVDYEMWNGTNTLHDPKCSCAFEPDK